MKDIKTITFWVCILSILMGVAYLITDDKTIFGIISMNIGWFCGIMYGKHEN